MAIAESEQSPAPDGAAAGLEERLSNISHFRDPSLLRGCKPLVMLRGWGTILATSEGSAQTYNMSSQVDHIDEFISHNWSTPRWTKFLALLLHFNLGIAVVLSLISSLACFILSATGGLTLFEVIPGCESSRMGFYCMIFGNVGLFLGLLFGRRFIICIGCFQRTAFLDKACIHQMDTTRKAAGIASLAAFLHHSRQLVVLYTDEYLQRLWTVYEVASFLTFRSYSDIIVEPVYRAMIFLLVSSFTFCSIFLWNILGLRAVHLPDCWWAMLSFFLAPAGVAFCVAGRLLELTRENISARVGAFSIRRAACFAEGDRALVESNVELFMKHLRYVEEGESQEAALKAFDELVRREVPKAVTASLGHNAIPYRLVLCSTLTVPFMNADHLAAKIAAHAPAREQAVYLFCALSIWLAVIPTVAALGGRAGRASLHHKGLRLCLHMAASSIVATASLGALWAPLYLIREKAYSEDWALTVLVLGAVALFAVARVLYRSRHAAEPENRRARFQRLVDMMFSAIAAKGVPGVSLPPEAASIGRLALEQPDVVKPERRLLPPECSCSSRAAHGEPAETGHEEGPAPPMLPRPGLPKSPEVCSPSGPPEPLEVLPGHAAQTPAASCEGPIAAVIAATAVSAGCEHVVVTSL